MHNAVVVIGFVNLMLAVVEFLRPDLWARLWKAWAGHRLFRLHGVLLIGIAVLLASALPVPRFEWILWVSIIFLMSVGGTILTRPRQIAEPITQMYASQPAEAIRRVTYMDAAFRVLVGSCLILSVME